MLLRALNPTREQHGWHSSRTVIEIVNDDMPFLVDSVFNELARQGRPVQAIVHPVMRVERLASGRLLQVLPADGEPADHDLSESHMHVEIAQQAPECFAQIVHGLKQVLGDVRAAVVDWPRIRACVSSAVTDLDATPPPLPATEVEESKAFLRWLDQDNFTFLGYREYRFSRRKKQLVAEVVPHADLGLLRRHGRRGMEILRERAALPADVLQFLEQPRLLLVGKGPHKATVHRNVYPGCHWRQAIRYAGTSGWGTALRRTVHFGGLQHQPAAHSAAAPGASTGRLPRQDCRRTVMMADPCCISWRHFRETICFRSQTTTCARWPSASCSCVNGRARRCSCGAIPSHGSSRASSSSRSTGTTRSCDSTFSSCSRRVCRRLPVVRYADRPEFRDGPDPLCA